MSVCSFVWDSATVILLIQIYLLKKETLVWSYTLISVVKDGMHLSFLKEIFASKKYTFP